MKFQAFVMLQLALGLLMAFSTFCRLTKTDENTHREIRWAFLFEGTSAGLVSLAPFLPLFVPEARWQPFTTPAGVWLNLLLSVYIVQIVTARNWQAGCPSAFQRTCREPRRAMFAGWLAAPLVMLVVAVFVAGPNMAVAQARKGDSAPARDPVTVPIFAMKAGDTVRCVQADGCIIFTKQALAEEFARATRTRRAARPRNPIRRCRG